jgi:RNA polymerase sigma-70 factor (ECF subfamily)
LGVRDRGGWPARRISHARLLLQRRGWELREVRGTFEQMPDDELLNRYAAGDLEAFGVLLSRYERPLYNFVARHVRELDAAADLTQEAFARVVQNAGEFNRSAKFSTWLYTIARNLCIDHARRMKHRRHASLDASYGSGDDGGSPLVERVASGGADVEASAFSAALRDRIGSAVDALPEEQREVFLMRNLQHMSFAEIASVVGAPENTVKSRMRYALERLQAALSDCEDRASAEG